MMRKLLLSVLALFTATMSKADVNVNETNFPDANFRNFIKGEVYGSDGVLTSDEIAEITTIDVSDRYIQSLKGIEYFTAVSTLRCKSNQLTTLDLSKNKELRALDCSANQLTTLDLLWNAGLYSVNCSSNKLTTLNVSSCTQMTELRCQSNQLTVLDVSNNRDLMTLYCSTNQLTSLDVRNCNALTSMYCENNQLTELSMGSKLYLTSLTCSNNKMTSLDLSGCTSLRTLYSMNGQLTSLNVKNTKLTDLYCDANQLTALDLSGLSTLTSLYCSENKLKTLNLSSCTKLTMVNCSSNLINNEGMDTLVQNLPTVSSGSLNVRYGYSEGNVMTTTQVAAAKAKGWTPKAWNSNFYTWEEYAGVEPTPVIPPTPTVESIDINDETIFPDIRFRNFLKSQSYGADEILTAEEIASITNINMIGKYIESIKGIECFTALTILSCADNNLTELDVSKNTALTSLTCSNNKLTKLDVSKNAALTGLNCSLNYLTALDVSGCPLLTQLSCNQNQIKDAAMDSLVQSLPVTSNGNMLVYNNANSWSWKEQNVMTTIQVAAAKAKGWTPKWMDPNYGWAEYAGSEPVDGIESIHNSQFTTHNYYDLSGRRVKKAQKGLYIVGGKKVLIKK